MLDTIQQRMARGALWMVLFKFVERSLGLISTLILARLLTPEDFGVVAMALSFIFMAELLSAFGFDIALIHNQSATRADYDSAWTGNALLGLVITTLMLCLAHPIADFYKHPEVFWVVCALAVGPVLTGCENIGIVAFRKELDFRREFTFQVSRKLIGFCVVVPLAIILRNYWALVAGILVSKVAGTSISYLMHPFRPHFSFSGMRRLFKFSRWLLLNNMIEFLKERSPDFFIGRMLGAEKLGIYNVSYELANLPMTELSAPVDRALLPGFAKLTAREEVEAGYRNALGILATIALPAAAGIFAVAPFLVPVILGSKWLAAIPLMEVLAFNGVLLLMHASMCAILIGRGFPAYVSLANAGYAVIFVTLLAVLMPMFGALGAAYAAVSTSLLATPIYLAQMHRCLGIRPRAFFTAAIRPLLAAAAMALVVRALLPAEATGQIISNILWLLSGIAAGIVSYVGFAAALWMLAGRPDGAERIIFDRVRAFVSARIGARLAARKE
jgi:lipopolysaccharide exporter